MKEPDSFILTIDRDFYFLRKGVLISRCLDSLAKDTVWQSCKINGQIPAEASLQITYFAGNDDEIIYRGVPKRLDDLLSSPDMEGREKEALFRTFWQDTILNGTEFPLNQAKGRYLWLKLEYVSFGTESVIIYDLKIDFPLNSLADRLPEIYQQDNISYNLLTRFLGIFQSLLGELDDEIALAWSYLDPDLAGGEFLHWLGDWLALEHHQFWPEDKLRELVHNAYELYLSKGTRRSIEQIVEIYTGAKPFIVEQFQIERYRQESELFNLYAPLYGDNGYTFTVLVKGECLPDWQHYLELKQLIHSFKPAHTILNLVVLRPYIFLDGYTYLGINSVLSGSGSLVLNGKTAMPFDTRIERMEDGLSEE